MRKAALGFIVAALVSALGLSSCADPARTASVDTSADTSATVDATAPASVGLGRSRTPSPLPAVKATKKPAPPSNLASRLRTLPASTRQVVIVYSSGYGTSYASLETFEKTDGAWRSKFGKMNARIGSKGFTDNHKEGVATTPTGVYSFGSTMYGVRANPGVKYKYHKLVTDDWWNENPDSAAYNSFEHGGDPGGFSEALWEEVPQYNYFAVINYNIPVKVANPARGSGIFLHVAGSGATAGCVSLTQTNLLRVLEWLDPAANPRIVMAPSQNLDRY
ncbi:L,D-peptidoglycan transpeptidase YkuD, ErfK/YbiS/YcfS/YnhG family [Asanoa hainanensis]|uniref:L,D-peptidoglycan transpeptidase YkuD, ErfK/YbiS/YcfS/YnhG family n=1 Tax=Asanoa hainanensis TaxID=560556 RepID=A0A239PDD5_9ACTN|nr:L,D-transpeptidase family protein [Asanoa hainanensis]SNT64658.1 L,D-peptidoglycan transpeptidase YkuD, ErfK/YbiS/YcfS/YnhG family [Asanoa hainanensis]